MNNPVGAVSALDALKDISAPSNVAAPGVSQAGALQDSFPRLLDTPPPAAVEAPMRTGVLGSGNGLGNQILNSLEKLGRNLESFNAMGTAPSRVSQAVGTVSPRVKGAPPGGQNSDPVGALHDMFESGMHEQKQLYSTVFQFELVEESSQSMMKSLKSLLTQGGG